MPIESKKLANYYRELQEKWIFVKRTQQRNESNECEREREKERTRLRSNGGERLVRHMTNAHCHRFSVLEQVETYIRSHRMKHWHNEIVFIIVIVVVVFSAVEVISRSL